MTRSTRRGFTLVEAMMGTGVLVLVLGGVLGTTMLSSNLSAKLSRSAVTVQRGRLSVERIGLDIQAADRVLARYPTTGTPLFRADRTSTLILRIPRQGTPNAFDVAIYRTVASATEGPRVLQAYAASIVNGVESVARLEGVVAREVSAFRISLTAHETFLGNGSHMRWTLRSAAAGDDALSRQQLLVAGNELLHGNGEDVALDDRTLQFSSPPANGQLLDLFYNVDPDDVVLDGAGTNASIVTYGLVLSPKARDGSKRSDHRDTSIATRLSLRNR